jgi:hypothetical protein
VRTSDGDIGLIPKTSAIPCSFGKAVSSWHGRDEIQLDIAFDQKLIFHEIGAVEWVLAESKNGIGYVPKKYIQQLGHPYLESKPLHDLLKSNHFYEMKETTLGPQLMSCMFGDRTNPWIRVKHAQNEKEEMQTYERKGEWIKEMKGELVINADVYSAHTHVGNLLDVYTYLDVAADRLPAHTRVASRSIQMLSPVKNRDVLLYHYHPPCNSDFGISATQSLSADDDLSDEYPSPDGHIRAQVYISGYIFEKIDEQTTRVYWCGSMNPMGAIPTVVVTKVGNKILREKNENASKKFWRS